MTRLYTVGHSNYPLADFLDLLAQYEIALVIDVRAHPHARWATWFNREPLMRRLHAAGAAYRFEGQTLGARPNDPRAYTAAGRVSFAAVAAQPQFAAALSRAMRDAERQPTVLMCAEEDPLQCHRAILLARQLAERGCAVAHIRADGRLDSREHLEQRLLEAHGLHESIQPDLFAPDSLRTREQRLALAYEKQEAQRAWLRDGRRDGRRDTS